MESWSSKPCGHDCCLVFLVRFGRPRPGCFVFVFVFLSIGHFCRWLLSLWFFSPLVSISRHFPDLALRYILALLCIHSLGSYSPFISYIHRLSESKVSRCFCSHLGCFWHLIYLTLFIFDWQLLCKESPNHTRLL